MEINDKTLEHAGALCGRAMQSYRTKINEAFLKSEKENIDISLKVSISPGTEEGQFKTVVDLSFVAEKIKDTFTDYVDQGPTLFEDQEPVVKCPVRGIPVFESVCGGCKDREEFFVSEPNEAGEFLTHTRSCSTWADRDHHEWVNRLIVASESWISEHPEKQMNECGKETMDGVCSELWINPKDGDYQSACTMEDVFENIINIKCCRECDQEICSSRCKLADKKKSKKKRTKKAA